LASIDTGLLDFTGVILVLVAGLFLLVSNNWRWTILALLVQYAGVFILVSSVWPIPLALIKLVAGWISAVVLAMAMVSAPPEPLEFPEVEARFRFRDRIIQVRSFSSELFRILAAVMVLLVVFSIATRVADWVPGIRVAHSVGSFILIGLGLLHLGLTDHPFRMIVSLLTVFAGFEVLYAAVELSTLVAGLLALVNLSLALVGAYLIAPETSEEEV